MSSTKTPIYEWIVGAVVVIVVIIVCILIAKSTKPSPKSMVENFIQELYTATDQSTEVLIKSLTLPDKSDDVQNLIDTGTIDPSTVKAYKKALANYKTTLAELPR